MEHQRQGRNECLPTAVAVLIGIPKDDVIEWARAQDGIPDTATWNQFAFGNGNFWRYARLVLNHFIGEGYGIAYYSVRALGMEARRVYDADGCAPPQPRRRRTLHGRGFLTVTRRRFGHVVAFENGVVYDSNVDGPLPYRVWRNGPMKGWHVRAVLYVPAPKKGDSR